MLYNIVNFDELCWINSKYNDNSSGYFSCELQFYKCDCGFPDPDFPTADPDMFTCE